MKTNKNFPIAIATIFLTFVAALSSASLQAQTNPVDSKAVPVFAQAGVAIDIQDLTNLEKSPDIDEATFPITAQVCSGLLNIAAVHGYDDCFHLYTTQMKSSISCSQDKSQLHHYAVISGKENLVLGYIKCLDIAPLQAVLGSTNGSTNGSKDDSNMNNLIFVRLGSTNATPSEKEYGNADDNYYSWQDDSFPGVIYYWFNQPIFSDDAATSDKTSNGDLWFSATLYTLKYSNDSDSLSQRTWSQWWDQKKEDLIPTAGGLAADAGIAAFAGPSVVAVVETSPLLVAIGIPVALICGFGAGSLLAWETYSLCKTLVN